MKPEILFVLPAVASSFVLVPKPSIFVPLSPSVLASSWDNSNNQNESSNNNEGLLLNGLDQEMSKMSSKYAFTESDYLAAAKKRAEMRVESKHAGASDEDWQRIANEKKQQVGEIDDWENSQKEAGNIDSQILMFTEAPADGEDGEEPKLLLF